FPILGWQASVGSNDAVEAESTEVGHVPEIAPIGDVALAVVPRFPDALVDPVPDETSQHARMRIDLVPVFLEISKGVAHAVPILAGQDRPVVKRVARMIEQPFPTCVFRALVI